MISEPQLIDYIAETMAPGQRAMLEAELPRDRAAQQQLAEQQLMDQALRVALGRKVAEERIKNSILAVVRGVASEELRARVLADTTERRGQRPSVIDRAVSTSPRRGEDSPPYQSWNFLKDLGRRTRSWFSSLSGVRIQTLARTALRRYVTATVTAVIVIGVGFCLYQWQRPNIEAGKFAGVTGSPTLTHRGQRTSLRVQSSTAIQLGDRIETGDADKADIQFNDGTTLQLNFNTTLEIPKASFKRSIVSTFQRFNASPLQRPPTVKLLAGQVWAKVRKLTNAPQFTVQTPVATASVKGTEFGLKIQKAMAAKTKDQKSKIKNPLLAVLTVREGVVEFSNSFGKVDATAMTQSQATADPAPTDPKRVPNLKNFRLNRTHLAVTNRKLLLQAEPGWLVYPYRFGWIGATMGTVPVGEASMPPPLAQALTVVRITSVQPGSPAALSGLRAGDVISALNGQVMTNASHVRDTISTALNRPLALSILRADGPATFTVTPTERPHEPPRPNVPEQVRNALFHATAQLIVAGWYPQPEASNRISAIEAELEQLVRTYPDVAALHHNLAVLHESKDELGEAIRHYQRAVELDPTTPMYHLHLGTALRSIGNLDRSAEELEMATLLAPAWPLAAYWLADGYSLLEHHEEAVRVLDTALRLNPLDPSLWHQKAEVLLRARQPQTALPAALKAVELDPDLSLAQVVLGLVYHDLGQRDDAEAAQRKAIELGPPNESPYDNLANLVRDRGRVDEAEALYRKAIELEPDDASAMNGLGGVFFERRQMVEAEKWYRKAVEADPNSATFIGDLGNTLRFLGQLDQAEQLLRRAIELEPEHAVAYLNLGILCQQRQQWPEAEQLMLKAGELDPNLPVEQFLAMLYQAQGKVDQAEEALRQWLARNPNDVTACNELAWHLSERGIKLDEALTLATRAADLAETNTSAVVYSSILDTLGWVYYLRHELDQAEVCLKKAVELAGEGPASATKREHLKQVQQKKGKPGP
jgi:tetratricopeptide (TPR) repeat protein